MLPHSQCLISGGLGASVVLGTIVAQSMAIALRIRLFTTNAQYAYVARSSLTLLESNGGPPLGALARVADFVV